MISTFLFLRSFAVEIAFCDLHFAICMIFMICILNEWGGDAGGNLHSDAKARNHFSVLSFEGTTKKFVSTGPRLQAAASSTHRRRGQTWGCASLCIFACLALRRDKVDPARIPSKM